MKALATWSPAPYLNVTAVEREESRWLVTVCSRERACCPLCGVQSSSRHSVYPRTLGDLSAQGTPVTVRVRVSRWRCRNERCDRRIFAERLPKVAGPFARQTNRLAGITKDVLDAQQHCRLKAYFRLCREEGTKSEFETLLFDTRQELRVKAIRKIRRQCAEGDLATDIRYV
jgi:zinc-finger of transposase IS204/IS1001/IS1096/IS1165